MTLKNYEPLFRKISWEIRSMTLSSFNHGKINALAILIGSRVFDVNKVMRAYFGNSPKYTLGRDNENE